VETINHLITEGRFASRKEFIIKAIEYWIETYMKTSDDKERFAQIRAGIPSFIFEKISKLNVQDIHNFVYDAVISFLVKCLNDIIDEQSRIVELKTRPKIRYKQGEKREMQLITVHMPKYIVHILDELVKEGLSPSRAELIREAVRKYINERIFSEVEDMIMLGP